MLLGVVSGEPASEHAVHADEVEQRLQRVLAVQHRGVHRGSVVGGRTRRVAQPVRLVVGDVVAAVGRAQREVDDAGEPAGEPRTLDALRQRRERVAERVVGRERVGDRAREVGQRDARVRVGDGQLEHELRHAVVRRDVAQRHAGQQRIERRGDGGGQPFGQPRDVDRDRGACSALRELAHERCPQLVGVRGQVHHLERLVHEHAERGAARQVDERALRSFRSAVRRRGDSSSVSIEHPVDGRWCVGLVVATAQRLRDLLGDRPRRARWRAQQPRERPAPHVRLVHVARERRDVGDLAHRALPRGVRGGGHRARDADDVDRAVGTGREPCEP